MLKIGCHLSCAKGFLAMGKDAVKIGANTFQFFTRNPRGGKAKELDQEDISAFLAFWEKEGGYPLLAHAPYTLNACAAEESIREFAKNTMADDLRRLEYLPRSLYNFHPGSHVKQGPEKGIELISTQLNELLWPQQATTVLLETMAGKGSEVGRSFQELRAVIDRVTLSEKLGVCLDTCHVWDGGYDIRGNLEAVLEEFDRVLGLSRLKAIHLNDSMNPLGSRKDRHQKLCEGALGQETLDHLLHHPALRELPFYLETPNDLNGYAKEIALVKKLAAEPC